MFVIRMLPPIYVINLERSQARRDAMERQLLRLGLPFTFFKAIDGGKLDPTALPDYDAKKRHWYFGQDLSLSEIGCYLSHLHLIEKIVTEKPTYAVILEDDLNIDNEFAMVLHALGQLTASWDMIRLAGLRHRPTQALYPLTPQHTLTRLLNTANGAQGYALTPHGASKLLSAARPIIRPVDIMMDRYWHNRVDILAVQPYVVQARPDVQTDMQHLVPLRLPMGWDWGRVKLCRGGRKLKDSFGKRLTNQWRRYRRVYEFGGAKLD